MVSTMDLNKIYAPIKEELEKVEDRLRKNFPTTNSFLKKINEHLFQAKKQGKRIRPALVLFSSKISSNSNAGKLSNNPEVISLAVAIELIHTASLIHDDIIDNAIERHNQLTLHREYGSRTAILAGDILYAQAFNLLSEIGIPEIVQIMSEAVKRVCIGEIEETRKREALLNSVSSTAKNAFRDVASEKEYFSIIRNKTAVLMSACCEAGALLSWFTVPGSTNSLRPEASGQRAGQGQRSGLGAGNGDEAANLGNYGLNFGLAYQIIDDYLDLFGEKEKTGKSVGIDLKEGTLTLPLIRLREMMSQTQKANSKNLIKNFNQIVNSQNHQLRKLLLEYKILDYIREKTNFFLSQAKERIVSFHPSIYRDGLLSLTEYVYLREK